tara:strand:+ start:15154 stop:30045 length:14892 start_codon:yes stop_codon:yes gene_type:complete
MGVLDAINTPSIDPITGLSEEETKKNEFDKKKSDLLSSNPIDVTGPDAGLGFSRTSLVDQDLYDDALEGSAKLQNRQIGSLNVEHDDLEDMAAFGQSKASVWANGITKLAGKSLTAASGGIGALASSIGAIGTYAFTDADAKESFKGIFDNEFQRGLDNLNEAMDGKLPNYVSKEEREYGFFRSALTANFWANDLTNGLSFIAGAVITEALLTATTTATFGAAAPVQAAATAAMVARAARMLKLASKGGKAAKALSKVNKVSLGMKARQASIVARQLLSGAGYESGVEARHHLNSVKKELVQSYREDNGGENPEGEDLAYIQDLATQSANAVFGANLALVGYGNAMQFPKIFGAGARSAAKSATIKNARRGIIKDVTDGIVDPFKAAYKSYGNGKKMLSAAYHVGKNPFYEGFVEEGGQKWIDLAGQHASAEAYTNGKSATGMNAALGIMRAADDTFSEAYGAKESQKEIGIGFLLGAMGLPSFVKTKNKDGSEGKRKYDGMQGGVWDGLKDRLERREHIDRMVKYMNKNPSAVAAVKRNFENYAEQVNLQEQMDAALVENNMFAYKNLENDALFSYLHSRIEGGFYNDIKGEMEEVRNMSDEEFVQEFGYESEDLSPSEIADRKEKVVSSALVKAAKIKEATEAVDQAYIGENDKVRRGLIHAAATIENVDRREEELSNMIDDITDGAMRTDKDSSLYDQLRGTEAAGLDAGPDGNVTPALGRELGGDPFVNTEEDEALLAAWKKKNPTEAGKLDKQEEVKALLRDLRMVRQRRQDFLSNYNLLLTSQGQKEYLQMVDFFMDQENKSEVERVKAENEAAIRDGNMEKIFENSREDEFVVDVKGDGTDKKTYKFLDAYTLYNIKDGSDTIPSSVIFNNGTRTAALIEQLDQRGIERRKVREAVQRIQSTNVKKIQEVAESIEALDVRLAKAIGYIAERLSKKKNNRDAKGRFVSVKNLEEELVVATELQVEVAALRDKLLEDKATLEENQVFLDKMLKATESAKSLSMEDKLELERQVKEEGLELLSISGTTLQKDGTQKLSKESELTTNAEASVSRTEQALEAIMLQVDTLEDDIQKLQDYKDVLNRILKEDRVLQIIKDFRAAHPGIEPTYESITKFTNEDRQKYPALYEIQSSLTPNLFAELAVIEKAKKDQKFLEDEFYATEEKLEDLQSTLAAAKKRESLLLQMAEDKYRGMSKVQRSILFGRNYTSVQDRLSVINQEEQAEEDLARKTPKGTLTKKAEEGTEGTSTEEVFQDDPEDFGIAPEETTEEKQNKQEQAVKDENYKPDLATVGYNKTAGIDRADKANNLDPKHMSPSQRTFFKFVDSLSNAIVASGAYKVIAVTKDNNPFDTLSDDSFYPDVDGQKDIILVVCYQKTGLPVKMGDSLVYTSMMLPKPIEYFSSKLEEAEKVALHKELTDEHIALRTSIESKEKGKNIYLELTGISKGMPHYGPKVRGEGAKSNRYVFPKNSVLGRITQSIESVHKIPLVIATKTSIAEFSTSFKAIIGEVYAVHKGRPVRMEKRNLNATEIETVIQVLTKYGRAIMSTDPAVKENADVIEGSDNQSVYKYLKEIIKFGRWEGFTHNPKFNIHTRMEGGIEMLYVGGVKMDIRSLDSQSTSVQKGRDPETGVMKESTISLYNEANVEVLRKFLANKTHNIDKKLIGNAQAPYTEFTIDAEGNFVEGTTYKNYKEYLMMPREGNESGAPLGTALIQEDPDNVNLTQFKFTYLKFNSSVPQVKPVQKPIVQKPVEQPTVTPQENPGEGTDFSAFTAALPAADPVPAPTPVVSNPEMGTSTDINSSQMTQGVEYDLVYTTAAGEQSKFKVSKTGSNDVLSLIDPDSVPAGIKALIEATNKMALEGITFNEAFGFISASTASVTGNLTIENIVLDPTVVTNSSTIEEKVIQDSSAQGPATEADIRRRWKEDLNIGIPIGSYVTGEMSPKAQLIKFRTYLTDVLGWKSMAIGYSNKKLTLDYLGAELKIPAELIQIGDAATNLGIDIKDVINAKYEAELAALKGSTSTQTVSESKVTDVGEGQSVSVVEKAFSEAQMEEHKDKADEHITDLHKEGQNFSLKKGHAAITFGPLDYQYSMGQGRTAKHNSREIPAWLQKLSRDVERKLGKPEGYYNHILINRYEDNKGIGRHKDAEPIYFDADNNVGSVAVYSIGETNDDHWLGGKTYNTGGKKFKAASGSIVEMSTGKMYHTAPGAKGVRYSINFRHIPSNKLPAQTVSEVELPKVNQEEMTGALGLDADNESFLNAWINNNSEDPNDQAADDNVQNLLKETVTEKYVKADLAKEIAWFEDKFPGIPIKVIKGLIGGKAYGRTLNAARVLISDLAVQGTTYHEAFHVVMGAFTAPETKAQVLEAYSRLTGITENVEEELAEEFRTFILLDGNYKIGEKAGKERNLIQRFFASLKDFFNTMLGRGSKKDREGLQSFFTAIQNNTFSDKTIEAEAEMSLDKRILLKSGSKLSVGLSKDLVESLIADTFGFFFKNSTAVQTDLSLQDLLELADRQHSEARASEVGRLINEAFNVRLGSLAKTYQALPKGSAEASGIMEMMRMIDQNRAEIKDGMFDWLKQFKVDFQGRVEEESTKFRDSYNVNEANEVNAKELAPALVKLLIATLPASRSNRNVNTVYSTGLVDYRPFFNLVMRELAGTESFEDQIAKLEALKSSHPEFGDVGGRKGTISFLIDRLEANAPVESLSPNAFKVQRQFRQQFHKFNSEDMLAIIEDDSRGGNYNSIRFIKANADRESALLIEEFRSNLKEMFSLGKGPFTKDPITEEMLVDLSKKMKIGKRSLSLNDFSEAGVFTADDVVDLLENFGIIFTDKESLTIKEKNAIYQNAVDGVISELIKLGESKTSIEDFYSTQSGAYSRVKKIIEIQAKRTDRTIDLQFQNAEGKTVYSIILNNFATNIVGRLNSGKIPDFLLDQNGNVKESIQGSLFLEGAMNGLKISLGSINGIKKKSSRFGNVFENASPRRRFNAEFAGIMQGIIPMIRASEKKTEFIFDLTYENDEGESIFKGMPTTRATFVAQMMKYLRMEIYKSKVAAGNNIADYKDNKHKLRLFSYLEDVVDLNAIDINNIDAYLKDNKTAISAGIIKYLEGRNETMIKEGIKTKLFYDNKDSFGTRLHMDVLKSMGNLVSEEARKDKLLTKRDVNNIVERFNMISLVGNIEQTILVLGDVGFFKANAYFKRTSGPHGPKKFADVSTKVNEWLARNYKRLDGKSPDGRLRTTVYRDVKGRIADSIFLDYAKVFGADVLAMQEKLVNPEAVVDPKTEEVYQTLKGYLEYEEGDAQGYITIDEYMEFLERVGDVTPNQRAVYAKLQADEKINATEMAYFTPLKPQYYGPTYNSEIYSPAFYKLSLLPLFPALMESVSPDSNLARMYSDMQDKGVGLTVFKSGVKIGAVVDANGEANNFYDETGIYEGIKDSNIQELYYEYMGIQVEMGDKVKDKTVRGVQQRGLLSSNAYDNGKVVNADVVKLDRELTKLENETVDAQFALLLDDLGISKTDKGYFVDDKGAEKFADMLMDEAKSRDMSDSYVEGLEEFLATDKETRVLDLLGNKPQIENLLYSLAANRVIRYKTFGAAKVQVASTGFEAVRVKATYQDKHTYGSNVEALKFYMQENGVTMAMEVMLPHYFKQLIGENVEVREDGIYKDGEKIGNSDLLEIFGYRIPTSALNSIDAIVIKGFLPESAGEAIMTPSEIVVKAGSDYDIDKLTLYFPNYVWNKGTNKLTMIKFLGTGTKVEDRVAQLRRLDPRKYKLLLETAGFKSGAMKAFQALSKQFQDTKLELGEHLQTVENQEILKRIDELYSKKRKANKAQKDNLDYEIGIEFSKLIKTIGIDDAGADVSLQSQLSKIESLFEKMDSQLVATIKADEAKKVPTISIERQNAQKAIDNAILTKSREIVLHPMNFEQLIRPVGADRLKGQANEIRGVQSKNQEKVDFSKLMEFEYIQEMGTRFWVGKQALGVAAVTNTHQIKAQRAGLAIKVEETINIPFPHHEVIVDENGDLSYGVGHAKDVSGLHYISEVIGEFINAFVDVANDPFVFDINANLITAGTYFGLLRIGVPLKHVTRFMTQDSIVRYVASQTDLPGVSKNDVIADVLIELNGFSPTMAEGFVSKASFATVEELEVLLKRTPELVAYEEAVTSGKTIEEAMSLTTLTKEEIHDYYSSQVDMLELYVAVSEGIAGPLSKLSQAVVGDRGGMTSKSRMETRIRDMQLSDLIMSDKFNNLDKYLEGSFQRSFEEAQREGGQMFNDLFMSDKDPAAKEVVYKLVKRVMGRALSLEDKAKYGDLVEHNFVSFVLATVGVKGDEIFTHASRLFQGNDSTPSLPRRIKHMKDAMRASGEKSLILNELFPILQKYDPTDTKFRIENIKKFSKRLTSYDRNVLIEDFQILMDKDPKLADDIVKFIIMQSGQMTSPISFLDIIPTAHYMRIVKPIIENFLLNPKSQDLSIFPEQFIRNNHKNEFVVERLKKQYLTPAESQNEEEARAKKLLSNEVKVTQNIAHRGMPIYKELQDYISIELEDPFLTAAEIKRRKDRKQSTKEVYLFKLAAGMVENQQALRQWKEDGKDYKAAPQQWKEVKWKQTTTLGDGMFLKEYGLGKPVSIIRKNNITKNNIDWTTKTADRNLKTIIAPLETQPVQQSSAGQYYEGNITPDKNTVFVFGSNPEGRHGAGAALVAKKQFGAKNGQGEGLQGNAYALPTKDLRVEENKSLRSISKEEIIKNIKRLYTVATRRKNNKFKVAFRNKLDETTLNGYSGAEMIEMFNAAGSIPSNIIFSKEWFDTGKLNLPKQTVATVIPTQTESVVMGDIFSMDGIPVIATSQDGSLSGLSSIAKAKGLEVSTTYTAKPGLVSLPVKASKDASPTLQSFITQIGNLNNTMQKSPEKKFLVSLLGLGPIDAQTIPGATYDAMLSGLKALLDTNPNATLVLPNTTNPALTGFIQTMETYFKC